MLNEQRRAEGAHRAPFSNPELAAGIPFGRAGPAAGTLRTSVAVALPTASQRVDRLRGKGKQHNS